MTLLRINITQVNYSWEILKILEENLQRLFKIYAKSLKMLEDNLEELPGVLKMLEDVPGILKNRLNDFAGALN